MLKVAEKKDSDLVIPTQQFAQLHASEGSIDRERELLEKDAEKKTEIEKETNWGSSFAVHGVYDPLPILARGKGFDEEPEAV